MQICEWPLQASESPRKAKIQFSVSLEKPEVAFSPPLAISGILRPGGALEGIRMPNMSNMVRSQNAYLGEKNYFRKLEVAFLATRVQLHSPLEPDT